MTGLVSPACGTYALDDLAARSPAIQKLSPRGSRGTSLLLAQAANPEQQSRVGNQTGGRVFLFLHTDDFQRDYQALLGHGVHFIEAPRYETYRTVVVFEDLYGNRWDLIERKGAA